jgi:hypothetical protein
MIELIEINSLEMSSGQCFLSRGMASQVNSNSIIGASSKAMPAGPTAGIKIKPDCIGQGLEASAP